VTETLATITPSAFQVTSSEDEERPGALVAYPYDRELVRRFREHFPRARWRPDEERWFVPGTTAATRLEAWIARELADLDRHADAKGRDAFTFDPIESRYLKARDDLEIRTPFSRAIVTELRQVPWARWSDETKAWHVPYRSYEELQRRWPAIEAEARDNEPEMRAERRARARDDPERIWWDGERRRRRYPVPADDPPPLDLPVSVHRFGVVIFTPAEGEFVDVAAFAERYPHLRPDDPAGYVWARWRVPERWEIYRLRRAKPVVDDEAARARRGWWPPSRDETDERLDTLRRPWRARGGAARQA
jgi:hypothetical protein